MMETQSPLAPTGPLTQTGRIESLDVLRGFAVLGILVMNIQSFSMIGAAYTNPTAYGDLTGANYWIWLIGHLLVDTKLMAIFSMLFGAGIVLMATRREAATGRSAGTHYRRMGWLLMIGLLHAHGVWYGDVLYHYAMCGLLIYLFRGCRPTVLIILGLAVLAVAPGISLMGHLTLPRWPPEAASQLQVGWQPTAESMKGEIDAYRGGWMEGFRHRSASAMFFETFLFAILFVWRAGGLMLIGMALFKLGVFSAKRSTAFYVVMLLVGGLIGIPIVLYGVRRNELNDWSFAACFFLGTMFNYWGSLLVALGWVGLIMLLCKHGVLRALTRRLAAAGQMALTNYLLQSVICTFVFYGHGFGLYGKVERTGQIGIVAAVCVFQLIASPLWLRRFRFGPVEWAWRSLTYWKRQPFGVAAASSS